MTRVFVFPGQGSQRVGMGRELFERFPAHTAAANECLGYRIEELCADDSGRLDQTEYTQPAIYVVNALKYLERAERGDSPACAAGHSLGEYNALLAAGAFDFLMGLRIVQRRGQLMASIEGGAMAAVTGLSEDDLRSELVRHDLGALDIGNRNSPRQFVLSGPRQEVERAAATLSGGADVEVRVLPVSGAFHSRYMAPLSASFVTFLKGIEFAPLRIPVLSNAYSEPYEQGSIADTLGAQLASPVRWTEIASRLLALENVEIEEIGTGRTLTALIRQLKTHQMEAERNRALMPEVKPVPQEITCRS